MVVAALENTVAPWAPFYFVYAALTVALPFALGAVPVRKVPIPRLRAWLAAVVIAVVAHLAFTAVAAVVDLPGMFAPMFAAAGVRLKRSPGAVAQAYLLFIVLWAALGEELFYRGYLQARLRRRLGPAAAVAVAALLFAVRHYVQLLLGWPNVLWGTATVWVAVAFLLGLALGWLYERSGSLLPPIVAHYLFNLLG